MNIAKLQAQLQRVPDQALIGYVQNPDGQVPSYLALAELSRRKEIRKSAQPQQAAPTQTIAAQEVAQAAPGIAQLPVRDDMFNEQSMAAGGIVAFEEGGEVKRFDGLDGSYVGYEPAPIQLAELGSNYRTSQEDIARRFQVAKNQFKAGKMPKATYDELVSTLNQESKQIKNSLPQSTGQYGGPNATAAYQEALGNTFLDKGYRGISNMASGIKNYAGDYVTDLATLPGQIRWVRDPATGKLVHAYETEGWMPRSSDKAPDRVAARAEANEIIEQSRPRQTTPAFLPYADPRMTADRNAAQIRADIAAGKYDQKAPPSPADTNVGGQQRIREAAGITYKPGADLSGEYDPLMRPEVSAQDAMTRYQGLLGTDVARDRVKERLEGMESRAAKEEQRAPWMALAEAGLGMAAGRSQFAIQNIAEGGKQGIRSYVDARDRLVRAEERRFDMASRIAQAERAEQVAAATHGLQSEERAKAHNDTVKQAKLGYKADREASIAKGNFEAKKFNLEYAQKEREIDLADKRIDKQIASLEKQSQRTELTNQRDALKALLQRSSDQLKTMLPDPKNPEYVSALNEYNRYAKQLEDLANKSYSGWGDVSVGKPK